MKTIPIEKIVARLEEKPFNGSEKELNEFILDRGAKSLVDAFLLGRKDFASTILVGTGICILVNTNENAQKTD
jgi:hypothetical protein